MLAFLLACAPSTPAPPPAAVDLTAYSGAERACLEASCAGAPSDADLQACRAEKCAATPAVWSVTPTLLRYDAGTVTMSVDVAHTPGAIGGAPVADPGETWLGATVLTKSGEEIDMAVHTVFPGRLDEPFTFSSEVGPDVEVVIVGLWGEKIEPCDSTRSGCKMFGFVLDASLGAWPAETYVATSPRRQRFLPASLSVLQVVPADATAAIDAGTAALRGLTDRFGSTFAPENQLVVGASAPAAVTVVHKHVHDGPVATELAEAVAKAAGEVPATACHDAAAIADLVVDLVNPPPAGATCR